MLPEAFVTVYLQQQRSRRHPDSARGTLQSPRLRSPALTGQQQQHERQLAMVDAEPLSAESVPNTSPAPEVADADALALKEEDDALPNIAELDYSPQSYFDGSFSDYPRGVHAFSGFMLSPTLCDMPPYSVVDELPN